METKWGWGKEMKGDTNWMRAGMDLINELAKPPMKGHSQMESGTSCTERYRELGKYS